MERNVEALKKVLLPMNNPTTQPTTARASAQDRVEGEFSQTEETRLYELLRWLRFNPAACEVPRDSERDRAVE